MYSVLGEDRSDVETIETLIKRLSTATKTVIRTKGYAGAGEMFKKGPGQLNVFSKLGCSKFIICYDSDRGDPEERKKQIIEKIIKPSAVKGDFCALVPVQELEAWILADLSCVTNIFRGWRAQSIANPENIDDPKEHLIRLSRLENQKPRYSNALHNPRLANYIDIKEVERKCPSFRPLAELVRTGKGNVP